jgi:hypothetical protein
MKLLPFLCTLALTLVSARAELGWTLEQCKQYFGPYRSRISKAFGNRVYDFEKAKYHLTVWLGSDEKVVGIEYRKLDKSPLLEGEIEALLENKGDCTWDAPSSNANGEIQWVGMDADQRARLIATYTDNLLQVCTMPAYWEAMEKLKHK